MRTYTLKEHTADVAVDAMADTLDDVFAAVADGMAAAMVEGAVPGTGSRFGFEEEAESLPALLYDYLDRLIYERDVREVLPVENEATIESTADGWIVEGRTRGVPLEDVDARDLKAVTYSDMVIEETPEGWHAYVVFDV